MSPADFDPRDEPDLADLLAACDEALASGNAPPPGLESLGDRAADDLACLRLLHQLRPSTFPPDDWPEPGERYSLVRRHGAGGVGQVWIARDRQLGREVALKELRGEKATDAAMVARFIREARITGQLQHPGIVPVYEFVPGDSPADGPFYTMQFVQGRTLTEAARTYHAGRARGTATALELANLLTAFVSVCHTVAYAHSRGFIHRDLKGENVVLGEFGEVVVLDWGFAKRLREPDVPASESLRDTSFVGQVSNLSEATVGSAQVENLCHDTGFVGQVSNLSEATADSAQVGNLSHGNGRPDQTQSGTVVGTPAYMSPEQAAGEADRLDERTDVFGLGAILYEVLTGRPPFVGDNMREVLRQAREEEPPRPESVNSAAPKGLVAICRKAIARDPANRYPSATELGSDVRHWLADEPVPAYREPLIRRWQRWSRRNRPIVASLAALLATGLVAVAIGAVLIEKERSRTAAVRVSAADAQANAEIVARRDAETQLYYQRIALAERELANQNLSRATQLLADCPEHLRDWEWQLLKRLCHADPLALTGHVGAVAALTFSPDGHVLASAGHDGTVRLWDPTTGRPIRTLAGHSDVVYGIAFSPNGRRIATGSWDRSLRIWDATTGTELTKVADLDEAVVRVAFTPDGRNIVSLTGKSVKLWDATTGAEVRSIGPTGGLNRYGLAIDSTGRIGVTTHDPAVFLYDSANGELLREFRGHTTVVKNLAFSRDGKLAASGGGDLTRSEPGELILWDPVEGRELFNLHGHTDPIFTSAFSPDARRLVSGSQDQTVKVWDTRSGREVLTIRAHTDTVRAVAFSPDGWLLATAGADGSIKVWDASPWSDEPPARELRVLSNHGSPVVGVAFLPDNRHLVALSDNSILRTWDIDGSRELEERRRTLPTQAHSMAVSPDGRRLTTATSDGIVHLFDSEGGIDEFRGAGTGPVKSLTFSQDGSMLAAAHWDRQALIWDAISGKVLQTLKGHADAVIAIAFNPDGTRVATAGYDKTVRVWDTATGQTLLKLEGHTSRIHAVAFSPDGKRLASAGNDGTVRFWDSATGQAGLVLRAHSSGAYGLAFARDGRLATSGNDWTVKVWDPATGTELRTFRGHGDRVHAVAFSADGRRLASASSDQTVRVWDVKGE